MGMEAVTLDTLRDDAAALAAEAKSLSRRARWVNQQSAALRDRIDQLQSKEDTSEHHRTEADQ
jgi:hypothetical protein